MPRCHQELGEGALARLIGSQSPDQYVPVEHDYPLDKG
jgi:hypothetical protein